MGIERLSHDSWIEAEEMPRVYHPCNFASKMTLIGRVPDQVENTGLLKQPGSPQF
jgi:hypothetical protein